jgi:flagellin
MAGNAVALSSLGAGTQTITLYDGPETIIANIEAITLDLSSASTAATSLDLIDTQMQKISNEISNIGTYQSRLGYATGALRNRVEMIASAESRIMSTDVAFESAQLVRTQILQQAAVSVLAQANAQPQLALQLLS